MVNNEKSYLKAKKLLEIYRGEVDDFFKLWPPDKQFFFSRDGKSFIAYGTYKNTAICMGDPVGNRSSINLLLMEFDGYCKDKKLKPAFIQNTNKYSDEFHQNNYKELDIGADGVINLDSFMSATVHNKYFRNIVNRFAKNSFSVSKHIPPHSNTIIDEVSDISDSWLKIPGKKEWSFLTGKYSRDYLQQVTIHIARDNNGNAQAFTNEITSFKPGVCTIDLMRHRLDSPANTMDYLFIELIKTKQSEGYNELNIGMSPLDGSQFANNYASKILQNAYRLTNGFIGFGGLHQFKSKYKPNWEPRYVWYQGRSYRLIFIARAISKLMQNN